MKGTCKICACTEDNACYNDKHGSCWWVDDTEELCSHCAIEEIREDSSTEHPFDDCPPNKEAFDILIENLL
ncbi:MAG: hypothetical protein LBN27_12165 [Prevotellaceae bacterium]|jgi:hypothetical protein|nr:hypothetical protein [Prevotellaceae bacterium]